MVAIHHRNETLLKQDGIYKYKTNKEEVYMSFMENTIIVYTLDFIDDIALSQYIYKHMFTLTNNTSCMSCSYKQNMTQH